VAGRPGDVAVEVRNRRTVTRMAGRERGDVEAGLIDMNFRALAGVAVAKRKDAGFVVLGAGPLG
jgi:hypothetical protein